MPAALLHLVASEEAPRQMLGRGRGPGGRGRRRCTQRTLLRDAGRGAGQVPVPDRLVQDVSAEPGRSLSGTNNGKPIRQVGATSNVLLAAHFFYHLGRAGRTSWATPGWNSPLLSAGWSASAIREIPAAHVVAGGRAGAGLRNTVVPKPATHCVAVRRDLPEGRPAAWRGQHRHRRRRDRAGAGSAPGDSNIAFTGLTEVGGPRLRGDAAARRQGRERRLRRRAVDGNLPLQGSLNGIFFNQGPRVTRGRLGCRSRCTTRCSRRCGGGWGRCGSVTAGGHDVCITAGAAAQDQQAGVVGRGRGRVPGGPRACCRTRLFCFAPTVFTRCPRRTGSRGRRSSGRCCPC